MEAILGLRIGKQSAGYRDTCRWILPVPDRTETDVADLLSIADLPDGFDYPPEFVRVVELGLTDLEPWWIFDGDLLRRRMAGLRERYPDRNLVPFASRQDNDDVACWDLDASDVSIVHDMAEPGWEQRGRFSDFNAWFRRAIEDLIEFGGL